MLRRLKTLRIAAAAAALAAATASGQTQGGLAGKLDAAEKQLQSDIKACKPIDVKAFDALVAEANRNWEIARKAALKAKVPFDQEQLSADKARADKLRNAAKAAACDLASKKYSHGGTSPPPYVDTKVEPPKLAPVAPAGQYDGSKAPKKPEPRPSQQPVNSLPVSAPMVLPEFASRIIAVHNAERAAVGAPPLRWDAALAASATAYAGVLARTGQLAHAPREGRGIARENLSEGMLGWGPLQMMRNWINEKRKFKVGIYPDVSTTGDWMDVSHYTQMIWPTTTDIGCGVAEGAGHAWMVCRYSPGGNKDGKPVGFTTVADANGPSLPRLRTDANGDVDTKVEQPVLWGRRADSATPSGGNKKGKPALVQRGISDFDLLSPNGSYSSLILYHAPYYSALAPELCARPSKPSAPVQCNAPKPTLCSSLGSNLEILSGLYLSSPLRPDFEYIPPSIDLVQDLSSPQVNTPPAETEKPFVLELKYSFGGETALNTFAETKVEQPDVGKMPAIFDPNAAPPEFIIIQTEPYVISVTSTKLSDCVM